MHKGNRTSLSNSSGYMPQVVCLQCTKLCACVCVLCVCVCRGTPVCTKARWGSLASCSIHPSQIYSFESRSLTEPGAMLGSQPALTVCICSLRQWVCCYVHCHTQLPSGMLRSDLRHLYHGTAKPTTCALMVAISPAPYQVS